MPTSVPGPTQENDPPPEFRQYDPTGPRKPPRKRQKLIVLTDELRAQNQATWQEKQREREEERQLEVVRKEDMQRAEQEARLRATLEAIKEHGYPTLFSFISSLYSTRNQQISSQVSKMVSEHAPQLHDFILHRDVTDRSRTWIRSNFAVILSTEMDKITKILQPEWNGDVSAVLAGFSLAGLLAASTDIAPNLREIIRGLLGYNEDQATRKKKDVVLAAVLSILAQCRNEKSSEVQTVTGVFLFACGAPRTMYDVLNHAGFCLSYTQTVTKIKGLAAERLELTRQVVRERACQIVYDNVNIAFRVGEQREDKKDHFDNGTTATLLPLYGVPYGSLPLSLIPPRKTRRIAYSFEPSTDYLPTLQQITEVEDCMLWHIEEILLEHYPSLQERLKACPELTPPMVMAIPVHKTEQYPLPAALIDESTITGTLEVIDHIFFKTLKLSEDEVKAHGVFFVHGDQLTCALLDTTSGSRRDDKVLADNPSRFVKPQMGLFHAKVAGTRCVANEFWGVANSKAAWSLWKVNTVLSRKPISGGWGVKPKQLPPYQTIVELVLRLALTANVLDGYRLYCGAGISLDVWVAGVKTHGDLRKVSRQVLEQLASGKRVHELRTRAVRDPVLENIILFNRDALILRAFQAAIKRGDIGTVVNVLAYWMVMFRGTGKMPKYADILFTTLAGLKAMDPKLRFDSLRNWLVNLSGKPNGFKEIDLLQEHHNFWLKIIYSAKGSNQSWKWLSLVSVCLFALRDVIKQVQRSFKTPYNGKKHTSPSIQADVAKLRGHLETHTIQTFTPDRVGNEGAVPSRDLLAAGAAYANTASAFKNFRDTRRAANYAQGRSAEPAHRTEGDESESDSEDELEDEVEMGTTEGELEDLVIGDDEFGNAREFIDILKGVMEKVVPGM
ncbi:hypothetical protein D9611_012206 [Ephemerocybe angulata]|uniref:DUF6589 domain-containing protein n=1 Tax=Ephemerocybe angulata TaxID=980116 RepID=A0A8H5C5A9_9AGAR|nr:hypothetical protein D9611_012206 [Tulosesus angulatus]